MIASDELGMPTSKAIANRVPLYVLVNLDIFREEISARTDITPNWYSVEGISVPHNGIHAVDDVRYEEPAHQTQRGHITGAPVPWCRNDNEEGREERESGPTAFCILSRRDARAPRTLGAPEAEGVPERKSRVESRAESR